MEPRTLEETPKVIFLEGLMLLWSIFLISPDQNKRAMSKLHLSQPNTTLLPPRLSFHQTDWSKLRCRAKRRC